MNPFHPKTMPRAVIVSYKASEKLIDFIKDMGLAVILSAKSSADPRIADHPDLQIHPIDKKTFIVDPDLYAYYEDKLSAYGIKLIRGKSRLKKAYPGDCPYNVARTFDSAILNMEAADERLVYELKKRKIKLIHANQAYAKCMCICLDDAIITCDRGIYKSLKDNADFTSTNDPYFISNQKIDLDGFDIGFLGGTCGMIKDELLFTGAFNKLEEYHKLKDILDRRKIAMTGPGGQLLDLGSIIGII